ncbi:MAG TPA: pyridoxine 5'-phosphate synthase [Planctomycetota bacterium]|nr:pyridoxine 5'-phosphate synthase [Planctomycetota bacterium]
MAKLGVNIDHVATVRQARRTYEPDPVWAAAEAELGGADQITVHLREDRRHIQDRDVEVLVKTVQTRVNLEMAVASDVLKFALKVKPHCACLVPEKRAEVTTEGGLDVAGALPKVRETVKRLKGAGIEVSLFIDPDERQIEAAAKSGAPFIELHTGTYANARAEDEVERTLHQLEAGARQALSMGLRVNAGHGLNYRNVIPVARIPRMEELNIGHSLVARAIFTGLREAVAEMKRIITEASRH